MTMSEDVVRERFIRALKDVEEAINEDLEGNIKAQMRMRGLLIKALYWCDRYITEQYFKGKSESKSKKSAKKKRR